MQLRRSDRVLTSADGFSLIEVLVAMLLLACSAAGVAGLTTRASRAIAVARADSWSAVLATQKMEQLRALAWRSDDTGPNGTGTDFTTDLSVDPSSSSGPGLSASISEALEVNTPGYVDYVDALGRWVGNGTTPPADAAFIRRWRVDWLPGSANRVIVFSVVVVPATRAGTTTATRLVSVKTRRSAP